MTLRTGLKSLDIKKIREQQGMNKKMPKQVRIKIIVDLLMTVLLMLLMAFELIGREEHEWLGVGMFAAFVVHHILNRKWTAHLLKGKYPPFRIAQTALVFLVLICMISSMVSGIVMSRYVFDFLPIQGGGPGWTAAQYTDHIAAIVAIEPGGAPAADSTDFQVLAEKNIPITMYFGDYIDNGDPAIQATGMWQAMRQTCYDFEEAYNEQGGNCTVVDLPEEGITGNDHFMFQDLNNDVIADHVQSWIEENAAL